MMCSLNLRLFAIVVVTSMLKKVTIGLTVSANEYAVIQIHIPNTMPCIQMNIVVDVKH